MSHKIRARGASRAPEPELAQMLFAAINEHEAALARVARLLHDDVSQVLSAVGLQLDAMRMDFREQAPGIEVRATEIQSMLEQVIGQLRDISNEYNPSIVERAGLQFALDRLIGKLNKTFPGTIRLQFDPATRIPTQLANSFYKIAECGLRMASARPGCTLIEMQVKRSHGDFVMEIHANGGVAEPDGDRQSLDYLVMDYHASQNNVALEINTSDDSGMVIRASHPIAGTERPN